MTSLQTGAFLILILLSAYLSASETALFSLSRFQLRSLKENFRPKYRKIKRLLSDPGGLLVTILVVNEVVNVTLSSLITEFVSAQNFAIPPPLEGIPRWAFNAVLGILIAAPIILFGCEITPKVIGARINQLVSTLTASPLLFIYLLFKPFRVILKQVIFIFSFQPKTQKSPEAKTNTYSSMDGNILREIDFLLMLEEGHREGAIQESELELIRNVFELGNTLVSKIATPLSQVRSLSINTTIKAALVAVKNDRYSRIPILSPNRNDVVGILYSKDLLRFRLPIESSQITVSSLMKKPFFIQPNMKLNTLFRKFKQHKIHMAILKNTNGDISGVVTMSDVLDTLFEDFIPEEEDTQTNELQMKMGRSPS